MNLCNNIYVLKKHKQKGRYFMKKFLVFSLGAAIFLGGTLFYSSQHVEAQDQINNVEVSSVQPIKIAGSMKIEGKTYKWMEASFGGTNRGYEINPGKMRYQLSPNPHNDPWYNKNQNKFYAQGADKIEAQANSGKWHTKGWPNKIENITIHGITYTLSK